MTWPLASSSWDADEISAMYKVIESKFFSMGSKTLEFEQQFASWADRKYAVMVNSGSSANLIAATAVRFINNGNLPLQDDGNIGEVIVPAVSWSTTFFPFSQNRYKLVYVDVDPLSFNINTDLVMKAISERTVGIVGVNLLGTPADWKSLQSIAKKFGLWLIEDNCESMGAESSQGKTGTFGDISTFSFFYSHHICTMEGGMAVTNDKDLYEAMRSIRAHGWAREIPLNQKFLGFERGSPWDENFRFYLPGYNLRPLELSAAVGSAQLNKIEMLLEKRRENAKVMGQELENNSTSWRLQEGGGNGSSWFTFGFVNHNKINGARYREKLIDILAREGIQSRPIVAGNFTSNPVSKWLDSRISGNLPVANLINDCGLMIGNHHEDLTAHILKLPNLLVESEN